MRKLRLALFVVGLAVVLYLIYYMVMGAASVLYTGKAPAVQPVKAPGQAQVATLPFVVGAVALAILVLTMGIGYVGVVVAIALVVAVFQQLGIAGAEYVAAAFAMGTALSAYRHAKPLFRAPRSVSILLAALAALVAVFSDLTPIVYGIVVVAQALASAFVDLAAPALGGQQNIFIAAVVLLILVRYIVMAVGMTKDPLVNTILTLAAGLVVLGVAGQVIEITFNSFVQAYGALGYAILILVSIVALADLFTALERARIDTLVWVAPLAVLVQISFGISIAPVVAALAGISAVMAAFTLSPRMMSTALILALAASVLV